MVAAWARAGRDQRGGGRGAGGGEGERRWDLGPRQLSPRGLCEERPEGAPNEWAGRAWVPQRTEAKGRRWEGAGLSCPLR